MLTGFLFNLLSALVWQIDLANHETIGFAHPKVRDEPLAESTFASQTTRKWSATA
jgi:hypothetical protein